MIYSGKLEIYFNLPESRTERNKKMFAKVLEFIGGIAFAVIGLSGWIILIKTMPRAIWHLSYAYS